MAESKETVATWIGTIECPCTTFEQDESCPVGQPSLLCGACGGKGIVSAETVQALAAEMLRVAEQVDELEDPYAAWESIELIKSQNDNFRKALEKIAKAETTVFDEDLQRDVSQWLDDEEMSSIARSALAKAEGRS